MLKKRYAICGLSTRAIYHFALPILGDIRKGGNDFSGRCELVGILDFDHARMVEFVTKTNRNIAIYGPGEMARMVQETGASTVLVGSPDYLHCEHIVAALEAGCDVVVEKPMVISSAETRRVREAEARTGHHVTVAFNYRYALQCQAIKRMIVAGKIGKITSVEFIYNLDTLHGSSYFYRWNRERAKSGGLNIHKCCHHFDLASWFIGDFPEEVFAFGKLNYFGSEGALRPHDSSGAPFDRVTEKENCPVFQKHYAARHKAVEPSVSTGWDTLLDLSMNQQYPAGRPRYLYDAEIDIEDTYSVVARYANGASLSYSCNFCTPWEGFVLGINGTKGRIEAEHRSNPDPTGLTFNREKHRKLTLLSLFGGSENIEIPEVLGGHDGADPIMQKDIFMEVSENSRELGLVAGSREGGVAVAMGEAVCLSIRDKRPVQIDESLRPANGTNQVSR